MSGYNDQGKLTQMPCQYCDNEEEGPPALLNIHGMNRQLPGEAVCWGHSHEEDWWPCQRKAAEEHAALKRLLVASDGVAVDHLMSYEIAEFEAAREFAHSVVEPGQ